MIDIIMISFTGATATLAALYWRGARTARLDARLADVRLYRSLMVVMVVASVTAAIGFVA